MNTKTASYIFLACLAIVGLWSAWGITQVTEEMKVAEGMIEEAEVQEDKALEEIEQTVKRMEAEAELRQSAERSIPLEANPGYDGSQWGSDTPD